MSIIEFITDIGSIEKSRKSLFVASIALPLFAGVNFRSESLSIFGLTIQIGQDRLVQIGRLIVIFLLLVFIFRLLPSLILWFAKFLESRDNAWATKVSADFPYYGGPEDDSNYPEPEDYEIKFQSAIDKKERRRNLILSLGNFISIAVASIINVLLPVLFGTLAFFYPYYLNDLVSILNGVSPARVMAP